MALHTGPGAGVSRLVPWLELLSGRLQRPASRREPDSLPATGRRRLLTDVGFGEAGLTELYRGEAHVRDLLPPMIRRFGLDPAWVEQRHMDVFRDLRRTCAVCRVARRCRRAQRARASAAVCGEFCANATPLEELLLEAGA